MALQRGEIPSMLLAMNWRRGVLFAAIHVLVAGCMLVWYESTFWRYIRSDRNQPVTLPNSDLGLGPHSNPCEGWRYCYGISPVQTILGFADLPVLLISGGHEPCNTPTQLDRLAQERFGKTRKSEALILLILCLGIAAQWFALGALPLSRPKHKWLEPGALITLCSLPVALMALLPYSIFPRTALIPLATVAWAYLIVVLIWRLFKWTWRLTANRLVRS